METERTKIVSCGQITQADSNMVKSALKQQILNHATDKYLTSGISKVSIAEIASDLGISKKTAYKFFPGKKILLEAVVDLIEKRLEKKLDFIRSSGSPFEDKLTDALTAIGQIFGMISR